MSGNTRKKCVMRQIVLALTVLSVLVVCTPQSSSFGAAAPLTLFTTEQQAQQHCPGDVVVWLNLPSGVYHFKGERWFGATKSGAYVCKLEADQNGDRATRNGQ